MKDIELENLKSELDLYKSDKLIGVLLWNSECTVCKDAIDAIEYVEADWPDWVFIKVHVEYPPIFAPGYIPAFTVFYLGTRIYECIGKHNVVELNKELQKLQTRLEEIKAGKHGNITNVYNN